jgi:hypothetical protein
LGSRNSQLKKRKIKNVPPPASNIGAEVSIASFTLGSLLKVAVIAPSGPSFGIVIQTINHGRSPRITKTAKRIEKPTSAFQTWWDIWIYDCIIDAY